MSNIIVEAEPAPVLGPLALEDQRLTTDLLRDLGQRTLSSASITSFAQGLQVIINLASVVVMARLLVPTDFGLVAMVTALTGLFVIVRDGGLAAATVQREGITHAQVSNLFWINVAIGILLSFCAAGMAPLAAYFYKEPRLTGITLAIGLTFLLRGPTIQQTAVLKRQMRFKMIAVIETGSMVAGFAVGVGLAVAGAGYWSLVGSMLAIEATRLVLAWELSTWRPQLPTRAAETGSLVRFGASMTAGGFLYFVSRSVDRVAIGRFYGPASVGLYSRATALFTRPLDQLLVPVESVFVPALSRLQADPSRYRRVFLRCYEILAMAGCLSAGLLLPLAHPFTFVLLGPQWEKAADILFGFAIAALYGPASAAASWLLSTQARGKDFMLMNLIASVLVVCSVIVALPFGAVGVALSLSVSGLLVRLPILYHIIGSRGPVNTWDLWFRFLRHLPLWIAVLSVTYLADQWRPHTTHFTELMFCILCGASAAIATILLLPYQRSLLLELASILRRLVRSKRDIFERATISSM